MNTTDKRITTNNDPLGLGRLEQIEPGYDGWAEIKSALQVQSSHKRSWQRTGTWMAVAASLVLAVIIGINQQQQAPGDLPDVATPGTSFASVPIEGAPLEDNIGAMIGLSQSMEEQVKHLRQKTASMPAESAIYVAELEDLIAQVDSELSLTPGSLDLWGQRVNLLLDLARIYQQQWQLDYSRMASL